MNNDISPEYFYLQALPNVVHFEYNYKDRSGLATVRVQSFYPANTCPSIPTKKPNDAPNAGLPYVFMRDMGAIS